MCGFAGFTSIAKELAPDILEAMGLRLQHRGPDEQRIWAERDVNLVHRRLAIQDLSSAGAQPMTSASGRYIIAFNGEIYNFFDLKAQLEELGASFRGHSDTEVLLAAIEQWGFKKALESLSGMFSFALMDLAENILSLARDRMGEKPLYYGWQKNTFLFGSELKALHCHPDFRGDIDRGALSLLLRHNQIPTPYSIYQGIYKLPPACLLSIDLTSLSAGGLPEPETYWSLERCFTPLNSSITLDEATDQLERLLSSVVSEQMISDVPLGAFLSGGIDSSTVVAIMQKTASQPVKTFSIGFREPGYNEADHARRVAEHLGTEHTELYVSPNEGLDIIPRLAEIYDEPFADSSQIPTFLVSQMTRNHVTVALSGDGGDELFCGYARYIAIAREWHGGQARRFGLRRLLSLMPPSIVVPLIKTVLPSQRQRSIFTLTHRLREKRGLAEAENIVSYYRNRVSFWPSSTNPVRGMEEPPYALNQKLPDNLSDDVLKIMMWLDLNWYLPDDILTKVDRAAMACSLETRIPLLDRRIVEFALGLPSGMNIQGGEGKQVLRNLLYRYVPSSLVDRPKQGFAVPLGRWLRNELRDWVEDLLSERRIKEQGFFDVHTIRELWKSHLDGYDDHSSRLWGVLMFQSWLETYSDN